MTSVVLNSPLEYLLPVSLQLTLKLFSEGIYYEAFYRHVESSRGTSMILETVSSQLAQPLANRRQFQLL